ncbi:MAG: hypothetical protein HY904_26235 [Deltaproteobacteria bacterium]|nr:hypothetical protein [Deltaproteobacteria bacterium]
MTPLPILVTVILAAAGAGPTLLVLNSSAQGGPRDDLAALLTDTLASTVQRRGAFSQVTAQSDVASVLSVETTKQLAGCDTDSCVLNAARGAQADFVLLVTLGRVGSVLVFNARLLDLRRGVLAGATSCQAPAHREDQLYAQIPAMVDELLGVVPRPAPPRAAPARSLFGTLRDDAARHAAHRPWVAALAVAGVLGCVGPAGLWCAAGAAQGLRFTPDTWLGPAGAATWVLGGAALALTLLLVLPVPLAGVAGVVPLGLAVRRFRPRLGDHAPAACVGGLACVGGAASAAVFAVGVTESTGSVLPWDPARVPRTYGAIFLGAPLLVGAGVLGTVLALTTGGAAAAVEALLWLAWFTYADAPAADAGER